MPWGALAGPAIPRPRCGADTQHVTWVAPWLLDRDPAPGPEVLRCFPPDRPGSPTPPELSWAARCLPSSCGLNRRGPPAPGAAGRPGTWPRLGLRAPLLPDRGPPWERWEAGWGGAMLPPSQTRAGDRARHKQMGTPAAAGSCTPPPLGEPPRKPRPEAPRLQSQMDLRVRLVPQDAGLVGGALEGAGRSQGHLPAQGPGQGLPTGEPTRRCSACSLPPIIPPTGGAAGAADGGPEQGGVASRCSCPFSEQEWAAVTKTRLWVPRWPVQLNTKQGKRATPPGSPEGYVGWAQVGRGRSQQTPVQRAAASQHRATGLVTRGSRTLTGGRDLVLTQPCHPRLMGRGPGHGEVQQPAHGHTAVKSRPASSHGPAWGPRPGAGLS